MGCMGHYPYTPLGGGLTGYPKALLSDCELEWLASA